MIKYKNLKTKHEAEQIFEILKEMYPDAECELDFKSPFELLVATILSAQCTDKRVNEVTDRLFKIYNTPAQFACLSEDELSKHIYSCGFYRNKSKNIISASRAIMVLGGEVPNDFDTLLTLSGVGRKTANVVMANAFGGDNIAVDTHVFRVSNRLGLSVAKTPEDVEEGLINIMNEGSRSGNHHYMIFHGRYCCKSQNPDCGNCRLIGFCEYIKENPGLTPEGGTVKK